MVESTLEERERVKPVSYAVRAARKIFERDLPGCELDYDYNLGIVWASGMRVWERPKDAQAGAWLPDACLRIGIATSTLEEAEREAAASAQAN